MEIDVKLLLQTFGSGITAALITLVVNICYSRAKARADATLELYARFHSTDFLESRIEADRILQKYDNNPDMPSFEQISKILAIDSWAHVSRVRHFFAQLELLVECGALDSKLVDKLFTSHVRYWFVRYFNRMWRTGDRTPHWEETQPGLLTWSTRSGT